MKPKISFHLSLLLLVVGATRQFDLTLIARVPLSEIIAFGSLPFLLRSLPLGRFQHRIFPVLAVLGLWALGILISDYLNGFASQLFIRGIAKPIFCFLWALFFLGILVRDYRLLVYLFYGAFFASLQNYLMPTATTEEYMLAGGYQEVAYLLAPIIKTFFVALAIWFYRFHHLYAVVALPLLHGACIKVCLIWVWILRSWPIGLFRKMTRGCIHSFLGIGVKFTVFS